MTAKHSKSLPKTKTAKGTSYAPVGGWRGVLLTLTLVPLILGVVLIIFWALDLETFGDPERLPPVALFFIMISFTLSNILQKRWFLSVGWAGLCIASLLLWISNQTAILVISFAFGLLGLGIIGFAFAQRISQNNPKNKG